MFNRLASHLDIASVPVPETDLIGWNSYRECDEVYPVWRVRQADWDSLKGYWPRRRFMTTLDVIKRELTELQKKADAVVKDEFAYTQELRALAFDLSSKIGSAIQACTLPVTEKAPF